MIPLPQKGDVKAATAAWNARVDAVTNDAGEVCVGAVYLRASGATGDGLVLLRQALGDLFDPAEFINEVGLDLVSHVISDTVETRDPQSAAATAILQAAAVGWLMERARWQR